MEDLMQYLLGFLFGVMCTLSTLYFIALRVRNRLKEKLSGIQGDLDKVLGNLKSNVKTKAADLEKKRESIKTRLIAAQDLTNQQLELRSQAEQPSKNSIHSRYKNGLVSEIQKLEEQKADILQSILNDGFDPVITAITEGGEPRQMSLSEFLGKSVPAIEVPVEATADPSTPRKVGKFFVINGGKGDDGKGN